MQEQIKIDIPEGKVPLMEQTEDGVVITWKEKKLTYSEIYLDLFDKDQHISVPGYCGINCNSKQFNKKAEILRILTNIRNYFGKPDSYHRGYVIKYNKYNDILKVGNVNTVVDWTHEVLFKEHEHAEQAIKMLGDELKYLFEPW